MARASKEGHGSRRGLLLWWRMVSADRILDRDFWKALAPDLHIADAAFLHQDAKLPSGEHERLAAEGLQHDGYTQLRDIELGMDCPTMARVARRLSAEGLDPTFGFVYDEFWRPYFRLDRLFRHLLGAYTFLPNFWAWNIDPARGESGWSAHRDVGRAALLPDGSPKSLTIWIAISEATPRNGCLHMVPRHADPTYGTETDAHWKHSPEDVRPLPAKPGDVLIWNQAVLHWGGQSYPDASESRVSMSLEAQRLDQSLIEKPAIAPDEMLSFDLRLTLIGRKLLHYRHMYNAGPKLVELAQTIVDRRA